MDSSILQGARSAGGSPLRLANVEVDQLPEECAFGSDEELDFQLTPSLSEQMALVRHRRQLYRRTGSTRPETGRRHQKRVFRSHTASRPEMQLLGPPIRPLKRQDDHLAEHLEHESAQEHEHGKRRKLEEAGQYNCCGSPSLSATPGQSDPCPMDCDSLPGDCDPNDTTKSMNMSPQDDPVPATTYQVRDVPTGLAPGFHRHRPPTLRSESIRAAMAIEALRIDSGDMEKDAEPDEDMDQEPSTAGDLSDQTNNTPSGSERPLDTYKEHGLLRVKSGMNSSAGNRVLIHSVPRVRKRRVKRSESRPGTAEPEHGVL